MSQGKPRSLTEQGQNHGKRISKEDQAFFLSLELEVSRLFKQPQTGAVTVTASRLLAKRDSLAKLFCCP
jgi:hypothetical protein